jgi:hypothetical protein
VVQLWAPGHDEGHLAAWYEPAVRGGCEVDHLRFEGRVERGREPALWLYVDERDGSEHLLDITGDAFVLHTDERRRLGYRVERIEAPAVDGPLAVVLPFRRRSEGAE